MNDPIEFLFNSRELEDASEQEFDEIVQEWQNNIATPSSSMSSTTTTTTTTTEDVAVADNNRQSSNPPCINLLLSKSYQSDRDSAAVSQLSWVDQQGRRRPIHRPIETPLVSRVTRLLQATATTRGAAARISILQLQMPLHSFYATQTQVDELFEVLTTTEWPNLWCLELSAPFHSYLHFDGMWNTISILPAILQLLSSPDRWFKMLRRFELSHYKIGNDGCAQGIRTLASHRSDVNTLVLMDNKLTRLNETIIHDLTWSTKIQHLCLDRNELDEVGQESIAQLIRHPQAQLLALSINTCGINDRGCNAILESLEMNRMLKSLEWVLNNFSIEQGEARLASILDASNVTLYRAIFVATDDDDDDDDDEDENVSVELRKRLLENKSLDQLICRDLSRTSETHNHDGVSNQSNESLDDVLPLLLSSRQLVQMTALFVVLRHRPDQLRAVVAAMAAQFEKDQAHDDGEPSAQRRAV